jgi:hypothetical protein
VQIVYLDQNKWIDLARAVHQPTEHPAQRKVLEVLVEKANAKQLVLPLTATNIYETHKINDPQRRLALAYVQATLSQGLVFRGRHKRLEVEVSDLLRSAYNLPLLSRQPQWFLSNVFFESTLERDDSRLGTRISEKMIDYLRRDPPRMLFEYLVGTEDVSVWSIQ